MEYRQLGRTDIDVSALCLGTMTWGRQNSEAEAHEQMDYALGRGINFFDTAELYAVPPNAETYGKTEEIIGSWFSARNNRDRIVLASKVAGPGTPWIRNGKARLDRENITQALHHSLKRLKTDYIDLYQLHWPNRPAPHFGRQWRYDASGIDGQAEKDGFLEILETLGDLVKEGKIRHIGLSNETSWGVMSCLRLAEEKNLPRLVSIQNEYNLLCRLFEPDLAEIAIHENTGLLAWSPLSAGALSGKYLDGAMPEGTRRSLLTEPTHRATKQADAAIRAYMDVAEKHGLDICRMALSFVTSRPFVTSTIIGATTMEQLKNNIGAAALILDDAVLEDIETVWRDYPMPY